MAKSHVSGLTEAFVKKEPLYIAIYDAIKRTPKWRIPLSKCHVNVSGNTATFDVPQLIVDETFTAEVWLERETRDLYSATTKIVPVQRIEVSGGPTVNLIANSMLHISDWTLTLT